MRTQARGADAAMGLLSGRNRRKQFDALMLATALLAVACAGRLQLSRLLASTPPPPRDICEYVYPRDPARELAAMNDQLDRALRKLRSGQEPAWANDPPATQPVTMGPPMPQRQRVTDDRLGSISIVRTPSPGAE